MTPDRIRGELVIAPVSPIHIGSGGVFTGLDYSIRKQRFVVKDVRRFFEANRDSPDYALDAIESGLDIGDEFIRYSLPYHGAARPAPANAAQGPRSHRETGQGAFNNPFAAAFGGAGNAAAAKPKAAPAPRSDPGFTVGEVREFIKDPFGKPFLPASSLKGSLRTAIACALIETAKVPVQARDMGSMSRDRDGGWGKRERAFERFGKRLFGEQVIEDLLKALIVQDSPPLALDSGFAMCQVVIMNLGRDGFREKPGVSIHVEALMPGVAPVVMPFYIDRFRLKHDTGLGKALDGKGVALLSDPARLEQALRSHGQALAEGESDFYGKHKQGPQSTFFQLIARDPGIHLPLGFGTGWTAKTVGRVADPAEVHKIRKMFGTNRDGRYNKNMGTQGVETFPKTRKWAHGPTRKLPMGWCKVEIRWK